MDRAEMVRIFSPALAPVLDPDEIPEQVVDNQTRFTLQNIGVPTSVGDAVVTNLYGLMPLGEFLGGMQLPAWARSKNVLLLGLILDGFLCLNGNDGAVLMLTRELEEDPVEVASSLHVFVSILVGVSEAAHWTANPPDLDVTALIEQIDPRSLGASALWERVFENLVG
ncbi:SUKH-4 family immunity protein [Embleya sp. NPDC127516]|uniref:SUKH-4 family immunity protein n=1 Tax=Embleya sp. NPDC127516 TaxID=3363990 RepID=UPI00381918F4